jgi:hypothetical protein
MQSPSQPTGVIELALGSIAKSLTAGQGWCRNTLGKTDEAKPG